MSVNKWHGVTMVWSTGKDGRRKKVPMIYKKPEYRQFMRSMATAFKAQLQPVSGKARIDLVMCLNKDMDTDNPFKPIFDALEMAGILKNDRMNYAGSWERHDSTDGIDIIAVTVSPLGGDDGGNPEPEAVP